MQKASSVLAARQSRCRAIRSGSRTGWHLLPRFRRTADAIRDETCRREPGHAASCFLPCKPTKAADGAAPCRGAPEGSESGSRSHTTATRSLVVRGAPFSAKWARFPPPGAAPRPPHHAPRITTPHKQNVQKALRKATEPSCWILADLQARWHTPWQMGSLQRGGRLCHDRRRPKASCSSVIRWKFSGASAVALMLHFLLLVLVAVVGSTDDTMASGEGRVKFPHVTAQDIKRPPCSGPGVL